MTSIETISIVIAAISVVIGVILSLQSRKQALETRQAELFMNVYNRWNSRDIQTAYGYHRHLYRFNNREEYLRKYSIRPPLGSPENFESWFNAIRARNLGEQK